MQYILGILTVVGINIVAVLGVSLLIGFTGVFTFGHAAYMAIGAYTSALLTLKTGLPFLVCLAGGAAAAMLLAIPIGYPTLRLSGDYFVVASLGVAEIVVLLIENMHGITGGARGLVGIPPKSSIWIVWLIAVASVVLVRNFIDSRLGRNCVALRENELAAQTIAINPFRYKMIALIISAGLGGLAGGLLAHYTGVLHPSMFAFVKSEELVISVIFGGIGSVTGSVLSAIILTFLPEALRALSEWRLVIYGVLVVIIIIARPQGLFGYRELTREYLRRLFRRPQAPANMPIGGNN
ncbi:MAG TPA: branched-chain amino acid ABC transporter permease [Firmicutes bacterium]|nr:branched-chain amino acid ABC transporter permease [Bacillota bacterium]